MYISKVKIKNYKSYLESDELCLKPGFNLIVGQNNAGKTALLEAITSCIVEPHRSPITLPTPDSIVDPKSHVDLWISIDCNELEEMHKRMVKFPIPVPSKDEGTLPSRSKGLHDKRYHRELSDWVLNQEDFTLGVRRNAEGIYPIENASFDFYATPNGRGFTRNYIVSERMSDDSIRVTGLYTGDEEESDFGLMIARSLIEQIYLFRAERIIARCPVGMSDILMPDASNLAAVLDNLSRNPERFRRYNALIRQILPDITQITIDANNQDHDREVLVWSGDPKEERSDLAVRLSKCGTGIGQVLAILYVVFNSQYPRVILIDEPQSFLHPGAVRKLIDVLRINYPQHQYIVSTHSPSVINASSPSTITLIRHQEYVSNFQVVDVSNTNDLRTYLNEIGASLSDVFGADNILWVEGPTEADCFPLILEEIGDRGLMGTAIVAVRHTGDFEAKKDAHVKSILETYIQLTSHRSLLPPAIGFVFDREERNEAKRTEANKLGDEILRKLGRNPNGQLISFLPRRMYENYLLDPAAIAFTINQGDAEREHHITDTEVSKWIEDNRNKFKKPSPDGVEMPDEQWVINVDGANLLKNLFSEFSENRVEFQKTKHSVELTKWILDNSPEALKEVNDLLMDILSRGQFEPT